MQQPYTVAQSELYCARLPLHTSVAASSGVLSRPLVGLVPGGLLDEVSSRVRADSVARTQSIAQEVAHVMPASDALVNAWVGLL